MQLKSSLKSRDSRRHEVLMKFHFEPVQVAVVEASIALLSCRNLTGRCKLIGAGIAQW